MQLDQEKIEAAIVERAADELLSGDRDLSGLVSAEVKRRIDTIFAEGVRAEVDSAVAAAVMDGFEREYRRVDQWGKAEGAPTSIRKELDKIVSGYWSQNVDKRSGEPTTSSYGSITRAEYLMAQICAKDFSDQMKQAAISVTAALKDGFRAQLAGQVDKLLDELFRVKSLQDQGKAGKPW